MKLMGIVIFLLLAAVTGIGAVWLEDKATLRGRVTDLFGLPIPETVIEVFSEKLKSSLTVRADRNGEYKIDNLPDGRLKVSVKARGFRQEELTVSPGSGEDVLLDLALQVGQLADLPQMEVKGVVQQSGGGPLVDATVTLVNAFDHRVFVKARTDKNGRYRGVIAYPGQYIAYADKAGFAIEATAFTFRGISVQDSHTANFTLSKLNLP